MNNGITIIAKTLRSTGNRIYIEDYQIVNGCQTSHVLYDQRSNLDQSVLVPLRVIASRDSSLKAMMIQISFFMNAAHDNITTLPESRKLE
jgi:hypothetical protein